MLSQGRFDDALARVGTRGPLLVAVSGGVDSMVMADLFLRSSLGTPFALAHCNFNLRGEESDSDEALARAWAETNGVRFHSIAFDTLGYASSNGLSVEMAARDLRYSWFRDLVLNEGYAAVAVAHNQNDNAETLMLNLLRGTGLNGITGMREVSPDGLVIRPLLRFSRAEIEEYARSRGLSWREDRTNSDIAYKRNRIRHEIFGSFAKINPSFLDTLSRDMEHFSEAWEVVSDWLDSVKSVTWTEADGEAKVDISRLLSFKRWEYALFLSLRPFGFSSSVVDDIAALLKGGDSTLSGKVFHSPGYALVTTSSSLVVKKKEPCDAVSEIIVEAPGRFSLAGRVFEARLETLAPGESLKQADGTLIMDSAVLGFPFVARLWEEGDWMCPLGLRSRSGKPGKKKLSDLFTDLGRNRFDKADSVVVTRLGENGGHVLALLCSRIDESVRVPAGGNSVIRITEMELKDSV